MRHVTTVLALGILTSLLFASSGCGLITTKRVATTAGKYVAEKAYEKYKEDREVKKQQEREQRVEQTSYEEPE